MFLKEAQDRLKAGKSAIISKKISCDLLTPVQSLLKIKKHFPSHHFLFESVEKGSNKSRYSVIGLMPDLIFKSKDNQVFINYHAHQDIDDFSKVANGDVINELRNIINNSKIDGVEEFLASGLFGYMSYDMVRLMEDIGNDNLKDEINIPDSFFIRPQILIVFDSLFDIATISAPIFFQDNLDVDLAIKRAQDNIAKITDILSETEINRLYFTLNQDDITQKRQFSYSATKEEYCHMVQKAKEYIKQGDIFQVLPSLRCVSDFDIQDSFKLYRKLRSINPSPFLFYLKFADFVFMGSSPEIMVSLKNDLVTVRPLAGTRKRGKNLQEDQKIAQELLSDQKELAEHLMLIDLGRHDVGRVCQAGTVEVTEKMIIEHYSHVMHISSNVQGKIKEGKDALDALISGFPAGTVSGAPKIRAMQIIEELEDIKRSFYAGCVGYFASNGDMESCIALRSALIKDGQIYLQAGAGVVADSVPENEYQECLNKLAALMAAVDTV